MAKIKIRLTRRMPVLIDEEQWPILAEGVGYSYIGHHRLRFDDAALAELGLPQYRLIVRANRYEGTALVYGVLEGESAVDRSGGVLLRGIQDSLRATGNMMPDMWGIVDAVERVGDDIGLTDMAIDTIISRLPPVQM